jgi:hypothetical protein
MSATTTNPSTIRRGNYKYRASTDPNRVHQLAFVSQKQRARARAAASICSPPKSRKRQTFMGVFVLFAYVLVLEKNLKLFWHFCASLCASLRVGLHRNESPQTSHWSGKPLRYSVREGFEPSVPDKRYNALAKRRFRPLSHLTKICGAKAISWKRGASNETFGSDPPVATQNSRIQECCDADLGARLLVLLEFLNS